MKDNYDRSVCFSFFESYLEGAEKITEQFGLSFNLQFVLSATVAALTVGGKAIGKEIANKNSTKIVHTVGIVLNKFSKGRKNAWVELEEEDLNKKQN